MSSEWAQLLDRSWPSSCTPSPGLLILLGLSWTLFKVAQRVLARHFLFPGAFLFLRWKWECPVVCTWFPLDWLFLL